MTDLELTRLCAEALPNLPKMILHNGQWRFGFNKNCLGPPYDPLHDDAQAMALVKKFGLRIEPPDTCWNRGEWGISVYGAVSSNVDLNRAIVECVAAMQAQKGAAR